MTTTNQTRTPRAIAASLVPFIVLLAIGFALRGADAPFWQLLVIAVVAGLVGLLIGQVYVRGRSRR